MLYEPPHIFLEEGQIVFMLPLSPPLYNRGPGNWVYPQVAAATQAQYGKVIGVVRSYNPYTGAVIIATEGIYNVQVAASFNSAAVIPRGSLLQLSTVAGEDGRVIPVAPGTAGKSVGVVATHIPFGQLPTNRLIKCFIQFNTY